MVDVRSGGDRAPVVDAVLAALVSAVADGTAGLVVSGPAGIGKSTLARDVARRAGERSLEVVWVQATATSQHLAFGALAPYVPASDADLDMLPMLVTVRRALREVAGDRPLVLVVDDVPLLDDASALLVAQLVATDDAVLLATQRDGAALPEAIRRLVPARVELAPLDRDTSAAIVERLVGGPIERETFERLWRLADGNPLYLNELVLAGTETGAWSRSEHGWRLSDDLGPSPRLTELVDARFGGLDDGARLAAELLAAGEPLGLATVERLTSSSAVESLDEAGLIHIEVDGRRTSLRVAHPLYAEVLSARLSVLRRRRLYRLLANQIRDDGARRRDDSMRMVRWFFEAGDDPPVEALLPAARRAKAAGDTGFAEQVLLRCLDVEATFEAGYLLADLYFRQGRSAETVATLDRADLVAQHDEQRLTSLALRATDRYWNLGDHAEAEALLEQAAKLASGPVDRDLVVALRASLLATSRRFAEAESAARTCLGGRPSRASIDATVALGFALRAEGRGEEAVAVVRQMLADYAVFGDDAALMTTQVVGSLLSSALVDLGRLDEADESAASTLDAARVTGEAAALGFAELCRGYSLHHRGRFRAAIEAYAESCRHLHELRRPGMIRWPVIGQMLSHIEAGDVDGARRARAEVERLGPHPATLFDGFLARADAAMLRLDGRRDDACRALLAAAAEAAALADRVTAVSCLHDVVRLGRPELVLDALAEVAGVMDGAWARCYLDHARSAVAGDPSGLAGVASRFEQLGAMALAAEAAREAADAYASAGDQRSSSRWATEARRLDTFLERVGLPTARGLGGADPLTRREREIAELAAQGLANKVIAERLVLSPRTVESHLLRVFTKLGVRTRAELTDLLAPG